MVGARDLCLEGRDWDYQEGFSVLHGVPGWIGVEDTTGQLHDVPF